jgi:hypothetical protein
MSYRRNRRSVAVAQTVNWPAVAAAALTPVVSAGLWICLANALGLIARAAG